MALVDGYGVKYVPYREDGLSVVDSEDEAEEWDPYLNDEMSEQLPPLDSQSDPGTDRGSLEAGQSGRESSRRTSVVQISGVRSNRTSERQTERAIKARRHRRQTVVEVKEALDGIESALDFFRIEDGIGPIKQGWLLKKSPKAMLGWQRRYVVLNKTRMCYYTEPPTPHSKIVPQGTLDFELVAFQIECLWDPREFPLLTHSLSAQSSRPSNLATTHSVPSPPLVLTLQSPPSPSASSVHPPLRSLTSEQPAGSFLITSSRQSMSEMQGINTGTEMKRSSGIMVGLMGCCGARDYCCGPRGARAAKLATKEVVFRLRPQGSKRVFEFKAPYTEATAWVSLLGPLARGNNDHNLTYHSLAVARQPHFWKIDRVAPHKFQEIADTGDILLFRTRRTVSKIQRLLTRGAYDHVAMILRKKNGAIQILEAMGDTGVALQSWSMFVERGWFLAYERVVLRRVHFPRSRTKLKALAAFCKESVGKPYRLSVSKLLKQESFDEEEHKDFFCSELVANALKELGVLQRDGTASSQYWPSSFAARTSPPPPLEPNCSLDDELLVDFHLDSTISAQLEILGVTTY
eukprot:GHVN01073469.1.p2 GENE.GHVN01073469.1~~GHVN01073469.1.p2  ORF type:complete len:575 (+),score=84.09 GHVN01073469.1:3205-4929(+)